MVIFGDAIQSVESIAGAWRYASAVRPEQRPYISIFMSSSCCITLSSRIATTATEIYPEC